MKTQINFLPTLSWISLLLFLFTACGPTIHYIGNTYTQQATIDIFYSEKDVEEPYRTIGKMTHDKFIDYSAERLQSSMLAEARARGADGIIFHSMETDRNNDGGDDRLCIQADLIKYK